MAGKFEWQKFSSINLDDRFFDSLKEDYPPFSQWYKKKSDSNEDAIVFSDDDGLGAFLYLKSENETIELKDCTLPAVSRKKIGTLKLADRYQGQRLGEGTLGLALWIWRKSQESEIYITVYDKHPLLINLLEKFGFCLVGRKLDGECVYLRSRCNIDYSVPYKSFPFINPSFKKAGYIIINDYYHDTLFPYSELYRTLQEGVEISAANGMSKVYVGGQLSPHYNVGEPVLIYRKHTKEDGQKKSYKSCITSYCVITNIITVKAKNRYLITFEGLLEQIGNKSVFDENDMRKKYNEDNNMVIIEMLYCGYFGSGNNVTMNWLKTNGYWGEENQYPTDIQLTPNQFKEIISEGKVDVQNVIVD